MTQLKEAFELKITTYFGDEFVDQIINLCLVPEQKEGLNQYLIEVSRQLNLLEPSLYELGHERTKHHSHPHCTLMHLKISDEEALASIIDNLKNLFTQHFIIHLNGIETLNASAFMREKLLSGQAYALPALIHSASVKKDAALLDLQAEVALLTKAHVDMQITPQREKYQPHFTLWVHKDHREVSINQQACLNTANAYLHGKILSCRLVIGDCGPIGQLQQIVYESN